MQSFYDRLGNILRDRLETDEDPFDAWEPHAGNTRRAGNSTERTPPPRPGTQPKRVAVPHELVEDYRTLGIPPGSSPEECKSAWKRLLKASHPDMHALDERKQAESTRTAIRLNDSYHRIVRWFETGFVSRG